MEALYGCSISSRPLRDGPRPYVLQSQVAKLLKDPCTSQPLAIVAFRVRQLIDMNSAHTGQVAASDVYFYRLETEGMELTCKLLFLG